MTDKRCSTCDGKGAPMMIGVCPECGLPDRYTCRSTNMMIAAHNARQETKTMIKSTMLTASRIQDAFLHFLVTGPAPLICKTEGQRTGRICLSYTEAVAYFGEDKRPLQKDMSWMQPPAYFPTERFLERARRYSGALAKKQPPAQNIS